MMGGEREIFMGDPRRAKEGIAGGERREWDSGRGDVGGGARWAEAEVESEPKNLVRNKGEKAGAQRDCEGRGRPEKERWAG